MAKGLGKPNGFVGWVGQVQVTGYGQTQPAEAHTRPENPSGLPEPIKVSDLLPR
jgi:hypothetical protein